MKKTVVFIMGTAHCGSTLLDFVLGSHSHSFSLGELHYLGRHLDANWQEYPSICGICLNRCPVWNDSFPASVLKKHFSRKSLFLKLRSYYNRRFHNFYELFMGATDRQILIDSSKGPDWISRQVSPLAKWKSARPVLLFLYRDGRAVCSSMLRKYPERKMEDVASEWRYNISKRKEFFDTFSGLKMQMNYEDFTSEPEQMTRLICQQLNIDFEHSMLEFWRHEHHPVNGGNLGTKSIIHRYKNQYEDMQARLDANAERHFSTRYYENIGYMISPDLRWQSELSREQIQIFENVAGTVNDIYMNRAAYASYQNITNNE
jgi:hypothetical protein